MRKIIGLTGFKGSGKDTVASIIEKNLPNTMIVAFADPVKRATAEIFSVPFEMLLGRTPESRKWREEVHPFWSQHIPGITPRDMLTMVGSDVIRKYILDEMWVLNVEKVILDNPDMNVVISDVRFPIEEALLRKLSSKGLDSTLIKVHREVPEWTGYAKSLIEAKESDIENKMTNIGVHSSEWSQLYLEPDDILMNGNNISMKCLEKKVINLIK